MKLRSVAGDSLLCIPVVMDESIKGLNRLLRLIQTQEESVNGGS